MKPLILPILVCTAAWAQVADNPAALQREGADQREAIKVHDHIFLALGFGNTFLVTTPGGNVVIDTSSPVPARRHVKLLTAASAAPVRCIVLTHGHGDHAGGLSQWKTPTTQVIAQRNHVEFMNYQTRLQGFFALRNAA